MAYNLTAVSANATSMLGYVQNVNSILMEGWLGTIFLIGIAVVTFMGYIVATNSVSKSIGATSTVCFVLSVLLAAMGLVGNTVLLMLLVASAASLAFNFRNKVV
jgi:hypothetical protein